MAALTAWAEAADLDSVTYLDGRVTTLERRIALLEASVRQDH
ncbi:hypothetical protein [Sphingomonas sp. SUN019]|nr:hypothetical protein [Sphingomonas sp. SUN019]